MQRSAAFETASAVMPNSRYSPRRRGSTEAAHANKFAGIAEPARPVALDRGLMPIRGTRPENRGPVFARLLVEELKTRCRDHGRADVLTPASSSRAWPCDRDFRARRDERDVAAVLRLIHNVSAERDQVLAAVGSRKVGIACRDRHSTDGLVCDCSAQSQASAVSTASPGRNTSKLGIARSDARCLTGRGVGPSAPSRSIMRHHMNDAHSHQGRQPDRGAAVIGEGEERAAIGDEAAISAMPFIAAAMACSRTP